METGSARPLTANGIHKLPRLIVAEGHERVARARIARRAGSFPELARDLDGLETRPANFAGLEFVPLAGDEPERALTAIDLHVVETAPAFVATARELAAFQNARRTVLEVGEQGDPIIKIVWLATAQRMPLLQVCDESFHRADQQMGEINPVTEHVAEFARAGKLLDLSPTDAARAPVLQSARAEVIGHTEITALHEVRQITHGWNEAVGERGHVTNPGPVGGVGHRFGVRVIQRERLLTQNMFALRDGGQRDGRVGEIRRGNDDGVNIIPFHDVFVARGSDGNTGLLLRPPEGCGIGIAECDDLHIWAQGETGQMILQRDPAATNDGKVECCWARHGEVNNAVERGEGKPVASTGWSRLRLGRGLCQFG